MRTSASFVPAFATCAGAVVIAASVAFRRAMSGDSPSRLARTFSAAEASEKVRAKRAEKKAAADEEELDEVKALEAKLAAARAIA